MIFMSHVNSPYLINAIKFLSEVNYFCHGLEAEVSDKE